MKIKYIAVIIIVLFLFAGVNSGISRKNEETTSFDDVDWWNMYHHDKENTGYSSSNAPHTSNVAWMQEAPYYIDLSSPAIVDDRLYIGTSDTFYKEDFQYRRSIGILDIINNHQQTRYYYGLYCYNATTGSLIWEHPTNGMVDSSPAVINGKVYFVSTDFEVATIHCVNAESGLEIWQDDIDNFSFCSPTVADGSVFIVSMNVTTLSGNVYCYDAETGGREWTFPLMQNEYPPIMNPTIAYSDSLVYFISFNENSSLGMLYCLNAETGIEEWHFNLGFISDYYAISPVCIDGMVFANGMHEVTYRDRIFCIDAVSGSQNWMYYLPSQGYILSTPTSDNEYLYFVTLDEVYFSTIVYCIDIEYGTIHWSRLLGSLEIILCSPAVADGKLYFGSWMYGYVYCLDTTDGHTIWLYESDYMITSSPAVADDKMFIASSWGMIYAFEDLNSPPNKPIITGETQGYFGESYEYNFVSTDSNEDDIWYYVEWGDGTNSGWIGPYSSGQEITVSHTWDEQDTYTIRAKAKDIFDAESDWGTLEVTMPVNQPVQYPLIQWLLARFPNAFPILRHLLGLQ